LREAREIPLGQLSSSPFLHILTYPKSDLEEAARRIRELSSMGVSALRFKGVTLVDGIPILGKGCVGIVTQARLDGEVVALKVRRLDADRPSMEDEARLLRWANGVNVGPRLITATRNFLAMQFVEGTALFRWAENLGPKKKAVKMVVAGLLDACFRLDSIGLDHGELSHAPKNVLVKESCHPWIVDFESASTVRRVANVTSIMQYFLFGRVSRSLNTSAIFPERKTILKTLAEYKHQGSVESFQSLIEVLGLS
jgi:putative serine/threonine protein kinase